jgi:hypothetical protein
MPAADGMVFAVRSRVLPEFAAGVCPVNFAVAG